MHEILCRNNSIGSWVLRFVMASKWSHSAVLDDYRVTHSTFWGGGVQTISEDEFFLHYPNYVIRDMGIKPEFLKDARLWLREQEGKPYDWTALLSIGLQWFTSREWQQQDAWFCSELTETCRSLFGKPRFREEAARITPKHQEMTL